MAQFNILGKIITLDDDFIKKVENPVCPLNDDACHLYLLSHFKKELKQKGLWGNPSMEESFGYDGYIPGFKKLLNSYSDEDLSKIVRDELEKEYGSMRE